MKKGESKEMGISPREIYRELFVKFIWTKAGRISFKWDFVWTTLVHNVELYFEREKNVHFSAVETMLGKNELQENKTQRFGNNCFLP